MEQFGKKASVNDCVLFAASRALRRRKQLNARYDEKLRERVEFDAVDVSVSVAAPTGLVTPIVFNCDEKTVSQIGEDVKRLAKKAKENKLKPSEMTGGSFTVSNLGMLAVDAFYAIQNPPQCAILAVGSTKGRAVVDRSNTNNETISSSSDFLSESALTERRFLTATLSVDKRCVDESDAAEWLEVFADIFENADERFVV